MLHYLEHASGNSWEINQLKDQFKVHNEKYSCVCACMRARGGGGTCSELLKSFENDTHF